LQPQLRRQSCNLHGLDSQTEDLSYTPNTIIQGSSWLGQTDKDVTFQFSATLVAAPGSGDRVIFEVGGGSFGTSLVLQSTRLALQTDSDGLIDTNTGSVLGGNNGGSILNADLPYGDAAVHQYTVSLHIDTATPLSSRLNLFIDDSLALSVVPVTTGASTYAATSWAGGNNGSYFIGTGKSVVLLPAGHEAKFNGPEASVATSNSNLNIYFDTFVSEVPEPSSAILLGMAGFGFILRRRR